MTDSLTLERAITNFKTNQTARNAGRLIALLRKSTYYLLLPASLMEDHQAPRRAQIEEQIRQAEFEQVPVLLFDTETEAGKILPVFTNRQEMNRFPDVSDYAAIQVTFPALYLLVSGHDQMDNLLINPEGNALAFGRDEFLQGFSAADDPDRRADPAVLESRDGRSLAALEAVEALKRKAAEDPDVKTVWLAQQRLEDQSLRWFLVADSTAPARLPELARTFLQAQGGGSAGICLIHDPEALDIPADLDPVYQRTA